MTGAQPPHRRLLSHSGVTLRHLEIFAKMMAGATTAEVASAMGVSQPAVSASLRHLEGLLGLALFERAGRRLTPTHTARMLMRDVASVLSSLRGFSQRAEDLAAGVAGRLRVVATPPLANFHAAEALSRLFDLYPTLSASYDVQRLDEVYRAVQTGEADLGLGVFEGQIDTDLQITPLHRARMVALAPRDSDLARKKEVAPHDLVGRNFVGLASDSVLGVLIRDAFRDQGCAYRPRIEVRFCATAAALAGQGVGVALVDPYSAASHGFDNLTTLRFVPERMVSACVFTRRGVPHTEQLKSFVNLLREVLNRRA
ncbi:MAG: LysR family transcriptional regulator [Pikeienuella sp.]